jgi:hypothetical protein
LPRIPHLYLLLMGSVSVPGPAFSHRIQSSEKWQITGKHKLLG